MKKILLNNKKGQDFLIIFENFLKARCKNFTGLSFKGHRVLSESIYYSLFSNGKRFRPLLSFSIAQILEVPTQQILPWASAIEMVHTASLIHDDLPSMDNSAIRRGKASNHRRFGEDISLLAGSCLWMEAFQMIEPYTNTTNWLNILCTTCGFNGLMGGQAIDLRPEPSERYYTELYKMKTAHLISASITGVLDLQKNQDKDLHKLSWLIGHAFQLADDLEDYDTDTASSLITLIGKEKAKKRLHEMSRESLDIIKKYTVSTTLIKDLILFNSKKCGVKLDE